MGCQNYFNPFVNAAIALFQSLTGALQYANNTFSTSPLSTSHFSLEVTTLFLYPQYVSVTLGLVISLSYLQLHLINFGFYAYHLCLLYLWLTVTLMMCFKFSLKLFALAVGYSGIFHVSCHSCHASVVFNYCCKFHINTTIRLFCELLKQLSQQSQLHNMCSI